MQISNLGVRGFSTARVIGDVWWPHPAHDRGRPPCGIVSMSLAPGGDFVSRDNM